MRTLTYFVATTLDGFIARESGAWDGFIPEGDHIDDQIASLPETIPGHMRAPLGIDAPNRRFDTVLMGRGTYEPGLAIGAPSPYAHLQQYVFSTTVEAAAPDVHYVRGDALEVVRELKQRPGLGIWLCGGGKLAAALLPEIEEVELKQHPVLFHRGIPLFDGVGDDVRLARTSIHAYESGVTLQRYRVLR